MSKKILIVDDEEDFLNAIAIRLNHAGYETSVAKDGEEAYASLKKEKPDLILLDVQMPKMDGLEFIRKLKKDSKNKNIPIMVAWRFGLGRVVSLATDDGSKWGGEFLSKENSKVLTKAINWVIGDLTRKKNFDVRIKDTTLDRVMFVNVISDSLPHHEKLSFVKSDVNFYNAKFNPTRIGFYNFLGADAAVNYKNEFKNLGINDEFIKLVEQTQGKVFDKDDIDKILEFIKEKSKRIKVDTTEFKWPFLIAALFLFLTEIGLRRLWENKSYR